MSSTLARVISTSKPFRLCFAESFEGRGKIFCPAQAARARCVQEKTVTLSTPHAPRFFRRSKAHITRESEILSSAKREDAMKSKMLLLLPILILMLASAHTARAQDAPMAQQQRPKYRMELVWMMDNDDVSSTREYVFVIGVVGFRTLEGLKKFVAMLPAGSILEWSPGCRRTGSEPLLSSEEEMEKWKKFCEEHGIEFVLMPAG